MIPKVQVGQYWKSYEKGYPGTQTTVLVTNFSYNDKRVSGIVVASNDKHQPVGRVSDGWTILSAPHIWTQVEFQEKTKESMYIKLFEALNVELE